jgi:iduronate 2-sulfatase
VEDKYQLTDTMNTNEAVRLLTEEFPQSENNFFLAVGFHKPHLPFVAPQRFYDMYNIDEINVAPNPRPPTDMPHVAWSNSGELISYPDIQGLLHGALPSHGRFSVV